jgi:peptidoglycan/LPS O-acetylase OafA/YrhL
VTSATNTVSRVLHGTGRPLRRLVSDRRGRRSRPWPSLAERFDPRHNSLSILRLVLALTVVVVHANAIGWGTQPKLGDTHLGEVAVDGFFVISGFLVIRSALGLNSLRRYLWHRALRIMPGFWVCLLVVAFVVAPLIAWLQGRSPAFVLSADQSSFDYVVRNATLLIRQWDIGLMLTDGGDEGAMNGALWTLWYEAICYVIVAVIVTIVPRKWHSAAVGTLIVTMWIYISAQTLGAVGGPEFLPRFLLLFSLGSFAWLCAHRLRFTPALLTLAAVTFAAASATLPDYRVVGAVGFAYLLLWAVVALPVRVEPPADISYGMYVYHWPVEQILVAAGATAVGLSAFTFLAIAIAGALALCSWYLIEAPSLAYKRAVWVEAPLSRLLTVRRPWLAR